MEYRKCSKEQELHQIAEVYRYKDYKTFIISATRLLKETFQKQNFQNIFDNIYF